MTKAERKVFDFYKNSINMEIVSLVSKGEQVSPRLLAKAEIIQAMDEEFENIDKGGVGA